MVRGARLAAAAALLMSAGCEVGLTQTRRRVAGPVKEVGLIDPGAGQVRYPLKGPAWLVARRRKRAYALMERHCGGAALFKVTGERGAELSETRFTEEDLDAEKLLDTGHYKVEKYRIVDFECVKP